MEYCFIEHVFVCRLLLHAHHALLQNTIYTEQVAASLQALTEVVKTAHQLSCNMYEVNGS